MAQRNGRQRQGTATERLGADSGYHDPPVPPSQAVRGGQREERETPRIVTLLNLVAELSVDASEREIVAAVMDLVEKRQVKLIGQFLEADIRGARLRMR